MYSPKRSNASAPAANLCQSNATSVFFPAASRIRTTAADTSGPIPSPGINVIACVVVAIALLNQLLSRLLNPLLRVSSTQQLFQLRLELTHILEVPIHTREADVR